MFIGMVLHLENNGAVILTDEFEFLYVKRYPNMAVGRKVRLHHIDIIDKKEHTYTVISVLTAITAVAALITYYLIN